MAPTRKTADAEAERRDYLALTPIEHDLEAFAPGARLALTEAEAAPLLAVGAVTDKPTKAQIASLMADQAEDETGDPEPTA